MTAVQVSVLDQLGVKHRIFSFSCPVHFTLALVLTEFRLQFEFSREGAASHSAGDFSPLAFTTSCPMTNVLSSSSEDNFLDSFLAKEQVLWLVQLVTET